MTLKDAIIQEQLGSQHRPNTLSLRDIVIISFCSLFVITHVSLLMFVTWGNYLSFIIPIVFVSFVVYKQIHIIKGKRSYAERLRTNHWEIFKDFCNSINYTDYQKEKLPLWVLYSFDELPLELVDIKEQLNNRKLYQTKEELYKLKFDKFYNPLIFDKENAWNKVLEKLRSMGDYNEYTPDQIFKISNKYKLSEHIEELSFDQLSLSLYLKSYKIAAERTIPAKDINWRNRKRQANRKVFRKIIFSTIIIASIALSIWSTYNSGKFDFWIFLLKAGLIAAVMFGISIRFKYSTIKQVREKFREYPTAMVALSNHDHIDPTGIWEEWQTFNDEDLDKLFCVDNNFLAIISNLLIPIKDEYLNLLHNYSKGIKSILEEKNKIDPFIQNKNTIRNPKANDKTNSYIVINDPYYIVQHLFEEQFFEFAQYVIWQKDKVELYGNNYDKFIASTNFLQKINKFNDSLLEIYSYFLCGWRVREHVFPYYRHLRNGELQYHPIKYYEFWLIGNDPRTPWDMVQNSYSELCEEIAKFGVYSKNRNPLLAFINENYEYTLNTTNQFCNLVPGELESINNEIKVLKNTSFFNMTISDFQKRIRSYNKTIYVSCLGIDYDDLQTDYFETLGQKECIGFAITQIRESKTFDETSPESLKKELERKLSRWDYAGGVKSFSLYNYLPSRFISDPSFNTTETESRRHSQILSFKNSGLGMYSPVESKEILDDLSWVFSTFLSGYTNDLMIFYVPSSTISDYRRRHEKLNYHLIKEFNIQSSLNLVRYHIDGSSKNSFLGKQDPTLEFAEKLFRNKLVIIFDDVITSGSTIGRYKNLIESFGGTVLCALSIGRTVHHHEEDPIQKMKFELNEFRS